MEEEEIGVIQDRDSVYVDVEARDWKKHDNQEFFGIEVDDDWPLYSVGDDSVLLNTVKLTMAKSNDSSYHIYRVRESRGDGRNKALQAAQQIDFSPIRMDSVIELPQGFYINKFNKFRNQRVWVVFEVPVGKKIKFSNTIDNYKWFNVHNRDNRWDDYDDQNDYDFYKDRPEPGHAYIMKADGHPERITSF